MGACYRGRFARAKLWEQMGSRLPLPARRHALDELAVASPVVYVVSPSAHPDAAMLALLQCARSLRLGSDAARQPATSEQEGAAPLHGGACASAEASSATKQQQLQAPDAGLAQHHGSVLQGCYSTHVAAGDTSQPVPCKAANDERWLTLQVCRCQQRHAYPEGLHAAYVRANS